MTEEEELQLALAASLEPFDATFQNRQGLGPDSHSLNSSEGAILSSNDEEDGDSSVDMGDDDDDDVAIVPTAPLKDLAQVAEEAAASLPPEPAVGTPGACRLAVRLPDGTRPARRFMETEPLRTIHTWCLSLCQEAAGGRPFGLALVQGFGKLLPHAIWNLPCDMGFPRHTCLGCGGASPMRLGGKVIGGGQGYDNRLKFPMGGPNSSAGIGTVRTENGGFCTGAPLTLAGNVRVCQVASARFHWGCFRSVVARNH
eukprot:jgi/Botrbrau1/6561/Bobra.40_2s0025.1